MYSNRKKTTVGYAVLANEKCADVDYKYGPYASIDEAWDTLGESGLDVVAKGLTVGIEDAEEGIVEYQFKKGVTKADLVRKFPKADDSQSADSDDEEIETPEIDNDSEVHAFLAGFENDQTLKEVIEDSQSKPLTEAQMQNLMNMFPTE